MLSSTEVALTSKLFVSRSDSGTGIEDQGLSLNEFDEDRDHDWRGELAETDTLGRPWGFEDDGAVERRGEEEENGRKRRGGDAEGKRKGVRVFFFFFFSPANSNNLISFFLKKKT
jgi:hypothetical protein